MTSSARIDDPAPTADELLAAYADDPSSLAPAERAAVEARCAQDPAAAEELAALRALLGELRTHDVAATGPDPALEARIKAAVAPSPHRARWMIGVGVALAAAAALGLWMRPRPVDGPGLGLAQLVRQAQPVAPPAPPAPTDVLDDDAALDDELAILDDDALDDDAALDDDDALDDGLDPDVLIGSAVERVPQATDDDGLMPGLDTEWIDDLSDAEVQQALRWLDQQGAG
jgi:hypothetical protein